MWVDNKLKKLMLQTIGEREYVVCFTHNNFPIWPFKEFGNSTSSLTRLQ